jgi:hypothetical protein
VGIISLNTGAVSYFRFEDKIIKIGMNPNLSRSGIDQGAQYLMALTEKTLEICDYNYLTVSGDHSSGNTFYRHNYFKFRIGSPDTVHLLQVRSQLKSLWAVGNRDRYIFNFPPSQ